MPSKYLSGVLIFALCLLQVKMVSEPAMSQMLVDLAECDKFAQSNPVPGIDKSILILIFSELRQLLELVLNNDWSVYFANYGKSSGKLIPLGRLFFLSNSIDRLWNCFTYHKRRDCFH